MAELLALKRLTASDLTFFERLFRKMNAGNQKSINLNSDILVGLLYPELPSVAAAQADGEISFPVTILGPAAAGPYRVRRKIIKGGTYKNWRLNGEFIYDPEGQPGRFDIMVPGDLAILSFDGRPSPQALTMILLASEASSDRALHAAFAPIVAGRKSMAAITAAEIRTAIEATGTLATHPLCILARDPEEEQELEDAALGGIRGIQSLRRRRRAHPISPTDFRKAQRAVEQTGADGEALVNAYLASLQHSDASFTYEWVSATNAVSPFDFFINSRDEITGIQKIKIDVKSTKGKFEANFHISMAELEEAANSTSPYLIYRVFGLTDQGGSLSVSQDIRNFAKTLLQAHNEAIPSGICADSFSVPVSAAGLSWEPSIRIAPTEEEE